MAEKNTFRLSLKQFQMILLLLLVLPFSATPLTFNFSSFPPAVTNNISMEGDAFSDGSLRLTKSARDEVINGSVGRATFKETFLLRSGDGLVFFLAPPGSLLNHTLGQGSSLGLPVNSRLANKTMSSTEYPFVAVEFDIFPNNKSESIDWCLNYVHAGIDINSLKSNVTEPWDGGISTAKENNATITYNSTSKNLSVAFTTIQIGVDGDEVQMIKSMYFLVDLLRYLPDRVIVGFSASTGNAVALHKIMSWNFTSTPLLDDNAALTTRSNNNREGLIVGLGVGGGATLVGLLALVWLILYRKRRETARESSDDDISVLNDMIPEEFEKGTVPTKFKYNELALATSNFVHGEKLGEGGFGGVYKGFIKDMNSYVAVKKISSGSKQGLKEYAAEVNIISRLRHRNLVQLIGWCHDKKLLLVYEFMPNGSLDSHLFNEKSLLTWEVRYKIAHGLASGLLYLHQGWEQCVLHRDIKSSNVMLDSNFNTKLGDFGLARLVDHGKMSQTTIVAGTRGYMALEYVTTGKASKQSDVYSFGVVALEIACGRKPIDLNLENTRVDMVEWVWGLYGEGKVIEAADPKLCGYFDEKQMEFLMMVGLWCAHPDYNMRPSMQQAIQVLNFEVAWPFLPLEMPMATFPQTSRPISSTNITGLEASKTESSYNGGYSSYSSSSSNRLIPSACESRRDDDGHDASLRLFLSAFRLDDDARLSSSPASAALFLSGLHGSLPLRLPRLSSSLRLFLSAFRLDDDTRLSSSSASAALFLSGSGLRASLPLRPPRLSYSPPQSPADSVGDDIELIEEVQGQTQTGNDLVVAEAEMPENKEPEVPEPKAPIEVVEEAPAATEISRGVPKKRRRGPASTLPKPASKLTSMVWHHFMKYQRELFTHRDGKKVHAGNENRALCIHCGADLKADSSFNGTSTLRRHIQKVCKKYAGRENIDDGQAVIAGDGEVEPEMEL
ncbi:PREDICTED: L-type lectin-domain containing receptor kinase IX.1-like [Fragaria vesca subsp. vesca]